MIGLTPSQYKALEILRNAPIFLSEKEVRERWDTVHIAYTSDERTSPVYFELNALVKLGLAEKLEKKGKKNQYYAEKHKKEVHDL